MIARLQWLLDEQFEQALDVAEYHDLHSQLRFEFANIQHASVGA
jgi:hypothetical protein